MKEQIKTAERQLFLSAKKCDKENLCYFMDGTEFSIFMQELLISKHGYVVDTGNYQNVNFRCAELLLDQIKKHPLIWKLFFRVA